MRCCQCFAHDIADHPHKSADSLIPFAASHISLHNFSVSSPHAPLFAANAKIRS